MDSNFSKLLDIAICAGKIILKTHKAEFTISTKDDKSPVTEADKKSHDYITNQLRKLYPNIPVLSEESNKEDCAQRLSWESYFLIDPLDGTKEFINKNNEFTVNIALISKNKPAIGIVHAPALGITFFASEGNGAFKILTNGSIVKLKSNSHNSKINIVISRSHFSPRTRKFIDLYSDEFKISEIKIGSSLKLCLIAEGKADIYPRMIPTSEWDIAAAHCILNESGGFIKVLDENIDLTYNKDSLRNPYFVAYANKQLYDHYLKSRF